MEVERLRCGVAGAPVAEAFSLMVLTVVAAEKSTYWLLFLIGSIRNNADALSDLLEAEKRFPFGDLNKVSSPDAECKESGESEDDSDDEDAKVDDDSDDDAEDSSGEEDDDEQGVGDSDSDANDDDDDEDEDEDDDDDDDEDDDDEEDDDDDDEDDDEEEGNQPPFKKIK